MVTPTSLPLLVIAIVFPSLAVSGQQTCQPGRYKQGQSCFACPRGTFSTITDARRADCLTCPVNSDCATSLSDGWSTWSCLSGFVYNTSSNSCVDNSVPTSGVAGASGVTSTVLPGSEATATEIASRTSAPLASSTNTNLAGNVLVVLNKQNPEAGPASVQLDSTAIYVLIGGGVVVLSGSGFAAMLYFRRSKSSRNQTLSTLTSPASMESGLFKSRQTTATTVKSARTPIAASTDGIVDYSRVNAALARTATAVTVSSVATGNTTATGDDPIPDDLDVEGMQIAHRTLKSFDDFLASTQVYVQK